ncbi:MAG: TonB-dependent receptor [Parvularculaceae bacterium]
MRLINTKRLMAGASVICLCIADSGVVLAQETAADDVITVTASRRSQSLQDTPLSVTAVKPDELATSGLTKLREVIEFAPGVNFAGGASPIANTITMRGVAQSGRATTVGVYIDDVPIGSSNSFASGPSLMFDAVQGDVERIELIKGPQGTLYGSSSMGGVVRYITKDPSTDGFEGSLKADLSGTRKGDFNQIYSGRLAAPIVKDKIGVSVSGYYDDFGGFIDRTAGSPTGAAENVDAYEAWGIYAKLVANPTDNINSSFLFAHTDLYSTGANSVALQGPPFSLADGPYLTDEGLNDLNDEFTLYAGTLNFDFGFASLVSSTSWQKRENSNSADLVATFGSLVELLSGSAAGSVTSAPFTGLTHTERFVQEIRLTSTDNDKVEWTIGGIFSDEDSSNIQTLEGQPINFVALDVDLGSELKELAGFGNLTYYFTPNFDLTAGVRVAKIKSSVALTDGPGIIVADIPETTSDDVVDTYSFTARYRPSEDLSLYARVASGYRPENANLPLLDAMGNNAAPAIIATDTLWSYEVGAKGDLAEGALTYDFAGWYIKWKDLQAVTFVNAATTGGNANSDVTAYGLEGSLTARPASGFSVITNFAYTHSTLDDDETAAFGALAGENLQLLPKWTASVRGSYDFAITSSLDGFINAGLRYVGDRDTGFEGGIGADGSTITPRIANFTLENYVVANLSAGIRKGPATLSVYANNLFDEYAFTGGAARPIVGGVRAGANVLQPRTIGAVLKVDF